MIEAMGYGVPIVVADTAINREICGNGAIYYPPLDPMSSAQALSKALAPDVSQRIALRAESERSNPLTGAGSVIQGNS